MSSGGVTLLLPSTISRSAGSSPGVCKPAGASPLVPSCRSAFSATGSTMTPTSPYSDTAAVDHQRQITSVKQMAQLFEDASSWQRDVRRQRQHHLVGVDMLAQSRQFAADRQSFAVNSQLFFFSTSTSTTTTTTTTSTMETSSKISDSHNTTFGHLRPAAEWRNSSADLRPAASGRQQRFCLRVLISGGSRKKIFGGLAPHHLGGNNG